jgi:hypothetical protein
VPASSPSAPAGPTAGHPTFHGQAVSEVEALRNEFAIVIKPPEGFVSEAELEAKERTALEAVAFAVMSATTAKGPDRKVHPSSQAVTWPWFEMMAQTATENRARKAGARLAKATPVLTQPASVPEPVALAS